ncbi:MAG: hypothetical protein EBZ58_07605 [Bacteroidetes bacterium]|nr:hypothetical protein [Bacteroidota bacterium]
MQLLKGKLLKERMLCKGNQEILQIRLVNVYNNFENYSWDFHSSSCSLKKLARHNNGSMIKCCVFWLKIQPRGKIY